MDIQPEKTCCFTGHRPQFFPWGSNTGDPAAAKMLRALESEILQAIADSYTTFLYGGALGVTLGRRRLCCGCVRICR